MQFNFFTWIREGVKQSVLLGVSDAVDQIGTLEHNEELNQQLHTALSFSTPSNEVVGVSKSPTRRKRLGRSLKDSNSSTAKD